MAEPGPSTCDFRMERCDAQEVVNAVITLMQVPGATEATEIRITPGEVGNLSDPRWDIDVQSVPLYVAVRLDETRTELRQRRQAKTLEERSARGAWVPGEPTSEDEPGSPPARCAECGHVPDRHNDRLGCTAVARSAFYGSITCPCPRYREPARG